MDEFWHRTCGVGTGAMAIASTSTSVRLISVDLQEHIADAQGRAIVMGDDDLDLLHAGHYRGMTADVATGLFLTEPRRQPDGSRRPGPGTRLSSAPDVLSPAGQRSGTRWRGVGQWAGAVRAQAVEDEGEIPPPQGWRGGGARAGFACAGGAG